MGIVEHIKERRIVIVYRGLSARDCRWASEALLEGGISMFEVTANSPDPAATIRLLRAEFGDAAHIGAGTVTTPEQLEAAARAGASYIISPHTDPDLIRRTRELGLASIPGAFSPTEVIEARNAGADMVKVFPISTGGPKHLRQLAGPIDDVAFMATGGVTLQMVPELFQAGAAAVALGLHLMGADPTVSKDRDFLRARAREFVQAARAQPAPAPPPQ